VECAGWRFEVLALEGRRIDQVLITPLPPASAAGSDQD
jgi:putative hemolysin